MTPEGSEIVRALRWEDIAENHNRTGSPSDLDLRAARHIERLEAERARYREALHVTSKVIRRVIADLHQHGKLVNAANAHTLLRARGRTVLADLAARQALEGDG